MSVIERLRASLRQHELRVAPREAVLPFGVSTLDTHLPEGGLNMSALHEMEGEAPAALFAAGILARIQGPVVWCIRHADLFAPALCQAGLPKERIIFVEAGHEQELLACFEEGLRHTGVAGVVGEMGKITLAASRRLQLAAESSGTIGIALLPKSAKRANTAAHTSWHVSPLSSSATPETKRARWKLELLRCRGAEPAQFIVDAYDETGYLAALPSTPSRQPAAAAPSEHRAAC